MKPLDPLDDPHSREATISLRAQIRHDHHEASDAEGEYIIDLYFKIFAEWSAGGGQVSEHEIEAGEVHLRLVRLSAAMDEDASLFELFDFDQSMSRLRELYDWEAPRWEFLPAILDVAPEANSFSDIFVIEKLVLRPWARRQGVGLRIIQLLLQSWQSGCSLAVIEPFPLQGESESLPENIEASTQKLTRYYRKLGFKSVRGCPFLIRSLEELGPRISDIDLPDYLLVPAVIAEELEV